MIPRSPFRRRLHPVVAVLAALLLAVTGLVAGTSISARGAPSGLTLTLRNDSGTTAPLYLYLLGTDLTSAGRDTLGYVDAAGAFHPWPAVASGAPQPAPDVALTGPATGATTTLTIPPGLSGRLYYSIGSPLEFNLVRDDLGRTRLVQPAPWVATDPNHDKLFDWVEFTYDNGIWINSTQVDQFALPAAVTVAGSSGERTTGLLVDGGRQQVIDALAGDPDLAGTVVRNRSGQVLRVLAPSHASREGLVDPGYLDAAIDRAWAAFGTTPLTVQPFSEQPSLTYQGRTIGTQLVFTAASGEQVAAFDKPSSVDVFECAGALDAPNDLVVGPIARTLCAALNRGTLGSGAVEPVTEASAFYRTTPTNGYAKAVHAAMADGRAYAFAFDDVAQQESLVHESDPSSVIVTIPSIGSGAGVGTPTASASPSASPTTSAPTTPTPTASATEASPAPSASASATATATPTNSGAQSVQVELSDGHPGYAQLTLGAGTAPGVVTVAVSEGSTASVAVDGPGTVRVDLNGAPGAHSVTVTGTSALGEVTLALP